MSTHLTQDAITTEQQTSNYYKFSRLSEDRIHEFFLFGQLTPNFEFPRFRLNVNIFHQRYFNSAIFQLVNQIS